MPTPGREDAIDPRAFGALLEVADGDAAFLRDLIEQYLGDGATLMDQVLEGVEAGAGEVVMRAAHTLKSSSGNVGALVLAALADQLQKKGREGVLDGCRALAESARRELDRVRQELEIHLAKLDD